jgi:5-methylcytosine-specific restriction endonuclease McrA
MLGASAFPWTDAQDGVVRELYPRAEWATILAALPHRNKTGIRHRALRLGVKREVRCTDEQKLLLSAKMKANPIRKGYAKFPVSTVDGVEGKVCAKCAVWQILTRFPKHATCTGGRRNLCTTCAGRAAYATNRDARIAAVRRWQVKHHDRFREIKNAAQRRRHGQEMSGPGISVKQYRAVMALFEGRCAYCPNLADTVDHMTPLSRGGQHEVSNLVPACRGCNFAKHDKTPHEWLSKSQESLER